MDRNEYGEAYKTGYGATRRFLLAHGAPMEDAEEISQAAWVRGWEYREQLREPGMLGFWVNSIARNLFRARFRTPMNVPLDGLNPSYSMDLDLIELSRLLDLPAEVIPVAVVPLGHLPEPLAPPKRRPLSEKAHLNRYGTPFPSTKT